VRFVFGALLYAAAFWVAGVLLWPIHVALPGDVWKAIIWGVLMELFASRREGRAAGGKPVSPMIAIGIGLGGLALAAVWWYRLGEFPTGPRLFALVGLIAYCLYYLALGVVRFRRGPALDRGVGT